MRDLSILPVLLLTTANAATELNLEIVGLKSPNSLVYIALYDKPEGFPAKGKPRAFAKAPSNGDKATASFSELPEGEYAVAVFEDLDGNGKLNANLFGLPTEPFGLSNNVRPRSGPPSFQQAAFPLRGSQLQTIQLHSRR